MAERKKPRGRKAADSMKVETPLTKEEKAIIHWVRKNVATKTTKFLHSHKVEYFGGSKAVDALVKDSPWCAEKVKEGSQHTFDSRERAIEFMDLMLKHKMFHRARKIPVHSEKKKNKKGKEKEEKTDTDREETDAKENKAADDKKKKRKIRLDMHLDQVFLDSQDAYVWLYDPTPWYYWIGGTAIVLGIIAICLFPLWPPVMRKGVHYLSIAAAGFLVFIIVLGIVKYIIFALLFALSGGKLKFWIFPNLTEDVGFLESFRPLYDYTYTGKVKQKAKDSDDEEEDDDEEEEEEDNENKSAAEQADHSESEDSSRKSSTGKDFEMVEGNNTEDDG